MELIDGLFRDKSEQDEWREGIWLSEQTIQRRRELFERFRDNSRMGIILCIGQRIINGMELLPNLEVLHTDILLGGNEQDMRRHIDEMLNGTGRVWGLDEYNINGEWGMSLTNRDYVNRRIPYIGKGINGIDSGNYDVLIGRT